MRHQSLWQFASGNPSMGQQYWVCKLKVTAQSLICLHAYSIANWPYLVKLVWAQKISIISTWREDEGKMNFRLVGWTTVKKKSNKKQST